MEKEKLKDEKLKEMEESFTMTMTWDDIYVAADGCACGEPNLQRKDLARAEIVAWVEENFGFNLEEEAAHNVIESVEEHLDTYAENYNLHFDEEGHLVSSTVVTTEAKASELVYFYDKLPNRPGKTLDAFNIALKLLRQIAGQEA